MRLHIGKAFNSLKLTDYLEEESLAGKNQGSTNFGLVGPFVLDHRTSLHAAQNVSHSCKNASIIIQLLIRLR